VEDVFEEEGADLGGLVAVLGPADGNVGGAGVFVGPGAVKGGADRPGDPVVSGPDSGDVLVGEGPDRLQGLGVVLIAQTWASLGPDETIRNRLAGTVGTVVAHQLKQPDEVAALAGTEWVLERTEQTRTLDHTGLGSQRAGNRYLVHHDEIRRLHQGEAFVIHGGRALKMRVRHPRARHGPVEP
jgi:hypothetical protein